jgi:L-threonylcarbamoyladenylate synthase
MFFLPMSKIAINQAITLLDQGQLVAIPTETVYGLAAKIDNQQAIEHIFKTKQRPLFDPLIVHTHCIGQAKKLSNAWPRAAELLAQAYWPGPLTLVLEKSDSVSDLISSGLDTVGLRVPNHPLSLQLLEKLNSPLAAPSANPFKKTSPTAFEHVEKYFPNLPILDGGDCQVGIESTIVAIKIIGDQTQIQILRSGIITEGQIKKTLSSIGDVHYNTNSELKKIHAPGMMEDHYMPDIPLALTSKTSSLEIQAQMPHQKIQILELGHDPYIVARTLYRKLHQASQSKEIDLLVIKLPPDASRDELWTAILDRLTKAASLNF